MFQQESKTVDQEVKPDQTEGQEAFNEPLENLQTLGPPELTSTPVAQDNTPLKLPVSEANSALSESITLTTTTTTTTTAPQPPLVPQPETQPVPPENQSRVYTLPDGYRTIGGDLCVGYGSLSRATLHGYWPSKNFQPGAHYTLPFLRDSYTPSILGSQTEEDSLRERAETPCDVKPDHPAPAYPTLGGIHQFRPITTMELLREPSRTR